jgi:hypothetical protein
MNGWGLLFFSGDTPPDQTPQRKPEPPPDAQPPEGHPSGAELPEVEVANTEIDF